MLVWMKSCVDDARRYRASHGHRATMVRIWDRFDWYNHGFGIYQLNVDSSPPVKGRPMNCAVINRRRLINELEDFNMS
jgi:hypothetical protein